MDHHQPNLVTKTNKGVLTKSFCVYIIGRPKLRWEDDVSEDIKSLNVRNWKNETQDGVRWKKVVEQARTLYRL